MGFLFIGALIYWGSDLLGFLFIGVLINGVPIYWGSDPLPPIPQQLQEAGDDSAPPSRAENESLKAKVEKLKEELAASKRSEGQENLGRGG